MVSALKVVSRRPGRVGQAFQQEVTETQVLVVVAHDKGDFGVGRAGVALVAPDGDEFSAVLDHQGEAVDVVDGREMAEFRGRQLGVNEKYRE